MQNPDCSPLNTWQIGQPMVDDDTPHKVYFFDEIGQLRPIEALVLHEGAVLLMENAADEDRLRRGQLRISVHDES